MLTVQLTVDGGKFCHPARNLGLQGLHFAFGRACARPGLFQRLLELPSLLDSELLFLGRALLELGIAALHLFEFGLQPRHLIMLFLERGLMRDGACNLAVFKISCAKIARSAY